MRATLGSQVTVIATEVWRADIAAGRGFVGGGGQGAVGGAYSYVQLLNPNASGKTARIRQAIVVVSGADTVYLKSYSTALATDDGAVANLQVGSAAGVCHARHTSDAGVLGTLMATFSFAAAGMLQLGPDWFAEVPANQGIMFMDATVNKSLICSFFLSEY